MYVSGEGKYSPSYFNYYYFTFFNQIKLIKIEASFTRVTWPRKAAVHLRKETDKQQITKLINIQYKVLSNLAIKM